MPAARVRVNNIRAKATRQSEGCKFFFALQGRHPQTPAGGSTSAVLKLGIDGAGTGVGIYYGSGAPTVTARKGSLYLRTDGSTINDRAYINTDGGTTWTPLTTGS